MAPGLRIWEYLISVNEQLQNALIASAFGLIGGGALNMFAAWWKRKRLHAQLKVYTSPPHQNFVPVRVHNRYVLPLTNCWAYISLHYDKEDIVGPPVGRKAHIFPAHPLVLSEDRLCWSVFVDGKNTPVADVYAGESQALMVLGYDASRQWIGIVSESMFNPWRVFLRANKIYKGRLKIVSREIAAKEWEIRIDLRDIEQPLHIRDLTSWFDPSDTW